jgi:hypothetical protein
MNLSACKLIFHYGKINNIEQITELIGKYTNEFSIANFYPDRQIGSNRTTFAVVNIPQNIIPKIINNELVKDIDLMESGSIAYKNKDSCCGNSCSC